MKRKTSPNNLIGSNLNSPSMEVYDPVDEDVLERMQFLVGEPKNQNRNRMEWYVRLANLEIKNCTDLNRKELLEEVMALRRFLSHHPNPKPPSHSSFQ